MREWLSGGAPPCQGGGRGFDPRLALEKRTIPNRYRSFFRALPGLESSMSTLRSANYSYRLDGNNVDIENENVMLAENQLKYQGLISSINQEFTNLQTVMK